MTTEALSAQAQEELPDEQLAAGYVDRTTAEVRSRLDSASHHLRFTQGYRPTHPGPRPHPEAGGMDHEDWEVASYEYNTYDQEDELERGQNDVDDAEEILDALLGLKTSVDSGDAEVISRLAGVERARIAEEERLVALMEERKGKEIPGAQDLYDKLVATFGPGATEGLPTMVVGANGWEYQNYYISGAEGGRMIFRRSPGKGPLRQYNEQIGVSVVVEGGTPRVHFSYAEIPEDAGVRYGGDGYRYTTKRGEHYSFAVDATGTVSGQRHRRAFSYQGNNAGNYDFPGKTPHIVTEGAEELALTEENVVKLSGRLDGLISDIEALKVAA